MIKLNVVKMPSKNWLIFIGGWLGIIIGIIGTCSTDNPNWIKFFDNLHWTSGTLSAALTLVLVLYLPKRGDLDFLLLMMMIPSLRLRVSFSLMLFIFASMVTAWSWMRWNLRMVFD